MPDRRALLLVNAKSRRGKADSAIAADLLKQQKIALIEEVTLDPRQIPQIIRRHQGAVDRVILGGGDGTFNAAIEALLESRLPLGILPMGTANDFARTLTIPLALPDACKVIAAGIRHAIDVGSVNGKHFLNVASMGLSVQCARRLTGDVKRRWGVLGYVLATRDALKATRSFSAEITCDGERSRVRAIQIAVGNGRHYGGGMTVAEDALIDDGRLDLYSLQPQSVWRLLALIPSMRSGRHGRWDNVQTWQGHRVAIATTRPMAVNTDGELTTHTPAEFSVLPSALTVFVPDTYAQQRREVRRATG